MVAVVIFLTAIIAFYLYSINYSNETEEIYNSLLYDGNIMADTLLTTGYPANWNSTSVLTIGITSNNKVNETKLAQFYNLSTSNYVQTQALFNTRHDYYINFSSQIHIFGSNISGLGVYPETYTNLIKISRFTIYKEKPTTLNLYIWD